MVPKAKLFKFSGYKIYPEKGEITFKYGVEFYDSKSLNFSETIVLPQKTENLNKKSVHKFLEPLSLILGISYYKLYCPPKIEIFFKLSEEEAEFWNIVYKKGLGEFLYRNKLDPKKIARFPYSKKVSQDSEHFSVKNRILLGIGGGKDSILASELLSKFPVTSFLVETQKEDFSTLNVIKEIGNPSLKIRRILDPKIFKSYEGSYNGHIPISAVFAFISLLSAFLYDYKYVVVGNEHTSNFGNLVYKGEEINHQWSKSAEFESMLQDYTKKFITNDIIYFSILRQFYEIRVAKMFAKHDKYFKFFTSCNKNFKVFKSRSENLWCGECPKCAFVFLILSPFLNKKELTDIFHKNLFADQKLFSLYNDLLGFGEMKPFDCVGTFDESKAALFLASKNFKDEPLIKKFIHKIKNGEELARQVFRAYNAPTLPAPFKLLGLEKVGILGYGREGKITEKYLKKRYSNLKIKILDESLDKNYLSKQTDCDFVIKTPGITMGKVKVPYTTATNLFFAENDFLNRNLTIGITGTKGKSTTAALLYEILKKSGKKVRLLGNIGNPMLETFLKPVSRNEIFVIELSSYMLEDIEYSPNIALMLNLFPEHMNYHGGLTNYYKAKNNIFKFQKPGDIALRPPFRAKLPFKKSETKLLGRHNLENTKAAVQIARILGVKDSPIRNAVISFKGLPHRLEYVGEFKGIKFYDDAISTTPQSAIEAIKALPETQTIMLGGEDRGYDFSELEKVLRKSNIKNIILFPETGKRILKSRKGFKILETKDMKKAVHFAFQNTPKGSICLLSTASPSYSLWKNFEEKGDLFKKFVKKYGKN